MDPQDHKKWGEKEIKTLCKGGLDFMKNCSKVMWKGFKLATV